MSVSQPCDEFVLFAIDSSPQLTPHEHSNNRDLYIGDAIESERAASYGVGTEEVEAVQQTLSDINPSLNQRNEPIEDNVAALALGSEDVLGHE